MKNVGSGFMDFRQTHASEKVSWKILNQVTYSNRPQVVNAAQAVTYPDQEILIAGKVLCFS